MTDFSLPGFKPAWSGKVRDIYIPPDHHNDLLAVITTDRVSAYDQVVGEVPGIGILRNQFTNFCKNLLRPIVSNDFFTDDVAFLSRCLPTGIDPQKMKGRISIVYHLKAIPVEFIVRGYLAGSLWKEYSENDYQAGYYQGNYLPAELCEGEKLDFPIFTPTTKGKPGEKDQPLEYKQMVKHIHEWIQADYMLKSAGYNADMVSQAAKSTALAVYGALYSYAYCRWNIIADLKLEFGLWPIVTKQGIALIDEISPDSFRAWPRDFYCPGREQVSLDKQPIRNFVKKNPGQPISAEVAKKTYDGYKRIYNSFTVNESAFFF